jgi:NADPH:quinone reductase-like Zn-dependent oxidoreductase
MATEQSERAGAGHFDGQTPTMRAIVQDRYGESDVLRLEQIPRPVIGDNEVLLRVHAAAVGRAVWHLMAGVPYPVRLAGIGVRAPKERVRWREVAGRVEAIGKDVRTLHVGDEVFGIGEGCFAEYARARADKLAPKPENLTFERAAALSDSALTALQAVRDHANVRAGQHVSIIGASGGVGTFAVQIAKAFGAQVTGVCSTGKLDLVRSIGADRVIDYRTGDISTGGQRYDVIIDIGGGRPLGMLRAALTAKGTLVVVGAETGGRWFGGLDRQLRALLVSPFVGQRLRPMVASENRADLLALAALVESGSVTPVIDRTYPLSETAAAIQWMVDGHARGKVVITV